MFSIVVLTLGNGICFIDKKEGLVMFEPLIPFLI